MHVKQSLPIRLLLFCSLLMAACGPIEFPDLSSNFVGGGTLASAAEEGARANFGFRFDGRVTPAKIHGTYHDPAAGVKLRFNGVISFIDGEGDSYPCMVAALSYVALGRNGGEGGLELAACDGGIAELTDDALFITINSGPFAGYENGGMILSGNLTDLGD